MYCEIERHSWKYQAGLSVGGDAARTARIRGLLTAHQPLQMVIQILILDGVPIAGLISGCFESHAGKGLYALQVVFDERYAAAAPGSLMLLLGTRHAIESGCAYFNLLSGFGHYKTRWLAESTATRSLQIYRVGSLPYWRRTLGDLQRWLLRKHVSMPAMNSRQHNAEPPLDAVVARTTIAERDRLALLLAQACRGECEWLSPQALANVLPFDVTNVAATESYPQAVCPVQSTLGTTRELAVGASCRSERAMTPLKLINSPTKTPSGAPTTPNRVMPT
jgi:hypothetical protein